MNQNDCNRPAAVCVFRDLAKMINTSSNTMYMSVLPYIKCVQSNVASVHQEHRGCGTDCSKSLVLSDDVTDLYSRNRDHDDISMVLNKNVLGKICLAS